MSDCAPAQPPELARSAAGRSSSPSQCSVKVGDIGQFKDASGRICQCVVRGFDDAPWEDDLLLIDYVHPVGGYKVTNAMIGRESFIPDNSPNVKVSEGSDQ